MNVWSRLARRSRHKESVPADIYIPIVDSLYGDSRSLFLGSLAVTLAVFLTAWRTNEPLLYVCALALAVVAVLRWLLVRAYRRHRAGIVTADDAHRWELRYTVGITAHIALLGAWCIIAFAATSDPLTQLVSIAGTISNLIGIAGRNFGSGRLVFVQIFCAVPLITIAFLIPGDLHYAIAGLFLVAFFVSMKFISDRLRKTLMDAVVTARDNTLLAGRFDAALNNMPLGLCMFDADRRLIVSNYESHKLLGLSADAVPAGCGLHELLLDAVHAGTLTRESADCAAAELQRRMSAAQDGSLEVPCADGRTFVLTYQSMRNGGSVVLIEDVTEKKAATAKINYLARYDALTALPNRTFFRDQMELTLARLRRSHESCAVLFVDLDQFKQINDTMGHPFGDALLCAVAERLRGIVRGSDLVTRFGGDEFVILQYPLARPDEAAQFARRIVDELNKPFQIERHEIVIGASIGIAVAPQDGLDPDLLLKNADMALYRTKSEGRGAWRFFEREMDEKAQARRTLEIDLRNALASDAFELYYQPLINLKANRIAGCEALLRWPHPERGMISPAEFIPIAEEMGLIVEIGERVLRRACFECASWPGNVRVAVNLSPTQFRRGDIVASVRKALSDSQLPPERLEIEITESVLVQDTEAARACLNQLREMGVRIALDDFGTGYSSLSYLHSFPLDKVKIDRSFMRGIATGGRPLTLLRGVARLTTELGMSVTVEGIETSEELTMVTRERSIDEAQGYLFSPPIPASAIRALLAAAVAPLAAVRHLAPVAKSAGKVRVA
jgi:diguanylate cyclase (GGDEF)-like protein